MTCCRAPLGTFSPFVRLYLYGNFRPIAEVLASSEVISGQRINKHNYSISSDSI